MKSDRQHLLDIVHYASEAIELVGGRALDDFLADSRTSYAVRYCLLVIGEASNRLSRATQDKLADVPWPEIRATRNRLAHAYDLVIDRIIFDTARDSLPALIVAIRRHLNTTPEQP